MSLFDIGLDLCRTSELQTRSLSAENPSGARGAGGKASSWLGPGRKGAPALSGLKPGDTVTLADIGGPGCIRHIWLTTGLSPAILRGLVLRAYWDGAEHPSIECPLGDFFGLAHGRNAPFTSALAAWQEGRGLNTYVPMPFAKHARITLEVDCDPAPDHVFYQIDYTAGDRVTEDVGNLCVAFRRQNPTHVKEDFVFLPRIEGKGRVLGFVVGVRSLFQDWWGEGELKVYLDGDTELPTLCGTGAEDYVGTAWGLGEHHALYAGAPVKRGDLVSFYRWHVPDPIYFHTDVHVTMQQIGYGMPGLFERHDDWSCAAFWHQPNPGPLPEALPDRAARLAGLLDPRPGEPGFKDQAP